MSWLVLTESGQQWWPQLTESFPFFAEPGCVSRNMSSTEWIQANLGNFSKFATLEDLLALNSNFSSVRSDCSTLFLRRPVLLRLSRVLANLCHHHSLFQAEALALLVPTQLAQLTVSSGPNLDTEQIDHIFDVLEEKDAFQNVDQFLEELSANEMVE